MHTVVGNKHWLLVFIPIEVEAIKVRLPQGYPIIVGSKVMLQNKAFMTTRVHRSIDFFGTRIS
ncbi:hypothetical protein C0W92_07670 [Photobacterium angustum]|nr:hypothetical protein UA69_00515 [Photobacterium angustum]PSW91166.1 hypothetical protein C0W92_07670 [Photobacterium angustum]